MRWLLLALALPALGCGSSDVACDDAEIRGTYRVWFTEAFGGTCGLLLDDMVSVDAVELENLVVPVEGSVNAPTQVNPPLSFEVLAPQSADPFGVADCQVMEAEASPDDCRRISLVRCTKQVIQPGTEERQFSRVDATARISLQPTEEDGSVLEGSMVLEAVVGAYANVGTTENPEYESFDEPNCTSTYAVVYERQP